MGFKAIPTLKAEAREGKGKEANAELREAGSTPANLYGMGKGNVELSLNTHEVEMSLRFAPALVELDSSTGKEHALIKEVQFDTFGQIVKHLDLMRVNLDDRVEATVPLEFYGNPVGAADGGRLETIKKNVLLSVKADKIPDLIRTNGAHLKLDESILYGDLELPEGAELLSSPEGIAASCRVNKRLLAAQKRAETKKAKE